MIRPLQEEVRSHLRSGVAITNLTQCVEELVLNSLDAGASCITVRVDIPNFKVQVSDNGSGIAFGDLNSVGERYSSSKCHVLEDLQRLSFYGFRGEALASIREICDVLEIVTRHRSSYLTHCKLFRNSQVLELTESRFPRASAGTSVTIHGVFTNLPVRRKAITEILDFERVRHRIASIALIHPQTAFLLINDSTGTKCLQTHVCKSVVSTFSQLFGNQRSKNLQPVKFEHKDFRVSGFISTDSHHSKSLQFLFVNDRLLLKTRIHKLVNHVLGKSELLRKLPVVESKDSSRSESHQSKTTSPQAAKIVDKRGIFVLNIECPVTEYDICLEPAKTLIEFQDWEKALFCVEKCVKEFLIQNNLFSNLEDSGISTESETNDDDNRMENSCYTNLEAFEYKREIETSNVKKSLHSSTVFRPKVPETRTCVGQSKNSTSLEKGHSDSSLSVGTLDHVCDSNTTEHGSEICKDRTASDCNSLSKAAALNTVDVAKNHSASTNTKEQELNESTKQVPFNDKTACHVTHTEGRTKVKDLNTVKETQNEVNRNRCTDVDHVSTSSAHSLCAFDSLQKEPTSYLRVPGTQHSNVPGTLLSELKNTSDRVFASYAFPRSTCSKSVSADKGGCLPKESNRSAGSVHLIEQERFTPLSSSTNNPGSSAALPRQTGTSSARINKQRTVPTPAFTSPCPITLKGRCTRKRPISNRKDPSVTNVALPSKNRRLITLQNSCQSRARNGHNDAGQFSVAKNDKCFSSNCDTSCSHVTQKSPDISCSTESSTTSDDNIVTQTSSDNLLDTARYQSDAQFPAPSSGVTVPGEEACDSGHSVDPIQPFSSNFIDQISSSRIGIESQLYKEHDSSVFSNTNVTENEQVVDNGTNCLDCPQKESTEIDEIVLKENPCPAITEPNSEPKLQIHENLVEKNDTHERTSSQDNDWYCTFDASLGRKLFINTRTGHSSFEGPCKFNVKDDNNSDKIVTEANEIEKGCSQRLPHPCASHLSFSCTPWLPRGDRRQQASSHCDDNNDISCPEGSSKSQIADLYKEHREQKDAEEKLCKWRDADTLQAYEQDLLNREGKTVAQLLDSWQNPVFTAPEKDILMINKPAGDRTQILVHNVVHPYCFTRDMLSNMRVLRQVDDKFIVGVVSQQGGNDGLLVLVDQHAAHERVRLERLQSELFEEVDMHKEKGKPCIKSSTVSPPLELSLFPEEVQLLKTFQAEIERIGIRFVISESSQVTQETVILIHGVPSVFVEREVSEVKRGRPSVAISNVKALIRDHLEHLSSTCGVATVIPKVISQVISSQACHGAVKFGEPLGTNECQELIRCLSKCQLPFQCAHGRPSVIPLVDLRFLGKKMNSEENVRRPRIAKLQLTNQ